MMGDKSFMADEERRTAALKAYSYLYLNLEVVDDTIEAIFLATTEEFSQRCAFLIFS
jgi:hypothetical protein